MKVQEANVQKDMQKDITENAVEAEHEQPAVPQSVFEYVGAQGRIRNSLLVACDGSYCRQTRRWGVGIIFLKTGNCLRFGGSFQSHDDFRVSPYTHYTEHPLPLRVS